MVFVPYLRYYFTVVICHLGEKQGLLAMVLIYIACIQGLVRPSIASSVFQPNCSIPPESTNLVLAPNVRGTFDILWTSVFTLITCCWTVQHLNVPRQHPKPKWPEKPKRVWRERVSYVSGWIKHTLLGVWPKLKWMMVTLLMPEFLVGEAYQDRYMATTSVREMKALAAESGEKFRWIEEGWTTTHGFYAVMGGFALRDQSSVDGNTIETALFLNLQSLIYAVYGRTEYNEGIDTDTDAETDTDTDLDTDTLSSDDVNLDASDDDDLAGRYTIPEITEDEIKDKSKSDFFMKFIAIGQLAWFIVQAVARGARGLEISQLEIAVLAYAACSIITFFLCLSKPKDVQVPTLLVRIPTQTQSSSTGDSKTQALSVIARRKLARFRPESWLGHAFMFLFKNKAAELGPIPNDALYFAKFAKPVLVHPHTPRLQEGFILAGMVFGAIHCAAWNSDFPTPIEQLLWRIASIFTATLLPVYYAVSFVNYRLNYQPPSAVRLTMMIISSYIVPLGYCLARLYLMVEIFRSLCFLPSSAFLTTWSSEIPHVA
ncbi:hypothetical protein F5Y13DRAFT_149042 [Hypoxylon sp. FL1857]|nr:hypothetical protein F5Y13DRAFT_149042 [Hypoxylon sp. FL1857]